MDSKPVVEGDGAKAAVSQDEAMDEQVMRERDDYEDRLTNLANAVGSYFDVPVGEWSNCNEPDRVALGILNGEYKTKFDALSPPAEPVELPLLGSPWRSDLRTNIPEQQRNKWRVMWANMDADDCQRQHYKHYEWECRKAFEELERRESQLLSLLQSQRLPRQEDGVGK